MLETHAQRLDNVAEKLNAGFRRNIDAKMRTLIEVASRLKHPRDQLNDRMKSFARWQEQLYALAPKLTEKSNQKIESYGKLLEAYSYKNILNRGFSVVRDAKGKTIANARDISNGDILDIEFKDNHHVKVQAGDKNTPAPKPKPKQKKAASASTQTSLFD